MKVKLMDKFIDNQKTEINAKEKEIEERGIFVKLQTLQDQVDQLKKSEQQVKDEYAQSA